jgi:hypothetical protein
MYISLSQSSKVFLADSANTSIGVSSPAQQPSESALAVAINNGAATISGGTISGVLSGRFDDRREAAPAKDSARI